jgi:isoleucyl-tRNA synthetase
VSEPISVESNLTRIEEEVRRFWRRRSIPEAALAAHPQGPLRVIYQQPLLAAGQVDDDQIRLLAVADLLTRYHLMQGDRVHRQLGWACHGLPIEVAVEQSLGPDLADYDLVRFNAACHEAAADGIQRGEALAERLGVWLDPTATYATLSPQAIGAVWGVLRRLWDAGRLEYQRRVVSVCPRCATPLSIMEASKRMVEVEGCDIWLRVPWEGEPEAYFLAWTPVPWMLMGMVALAAHPSASYALVEPTARHEPPVPRLLLSEKALERTPPGRFRLLRKVSGRSLHGARYRPPFTFQPAGDRMGRVILSEAVDLDQGTGLLPVTPSFDALSLALAETHSLPTPELLDDWGNLIDSVTPWRGLSPLDAEPFLIDSLRARGLLFRRRNEPRPRALCPYCEMPLLPQVRRVWAVETASGPWIVGRDRAWGTPLPVWVCDRCQEKVCVAGLDDLAHRTGLQVDQIGLHRPEVDQLRFPCEACGGTMQRLAPVVDAAFETAVLPWAVAPQPGAADLAVGVGDRHLGWLGDLAETAALLRGTLAWEQAVALPEGEGDAALGQELGQPADAVRWAAYTQTSPTQAERDFLRPLWRLVVPLLAGLPTFDQETGPAGKLLDRWLWARLHAATTSLTEMLDAHDSQRAAEQLSALVGDIADWYTPHRSGGACQVLGVVCRLLAPFAPHLAEAVYRRKGGTTDDSVHLAGWPSPDPAWKDRELLVRMAQVRRLVALGQAARLQGGVPPDQRLRQGVLYVHSMDEIAASEQFAWRELLANVLRVADLHLAPRAMAQVEWRLSLDPQRAFEREITPEAIDGALAKLAADEAMHITSRIWDGLSVSVEEGGQSVTLLPDEVRISVQARPGWIAAVERGLLVVLERGD